MEILNRKFSFLAPQRQACFRESMLWGFGSAFAVSSAWYLYRGALHHHVSSDFLPRRGLRRTSSHVRFTVSVDGIFCAMVK